MEIAEDPELRAHLATGPGVRQYNIYGREASWGKFHSVAQGLCLPDARAEVERLNTAVQSRFGSGLFGAPIFGCQLRLPQESKGHGCKAGDIVLAPFKHKTIDYVTHTVSGDSIAIGVAANATERTIEVVYPSGMTRELAAPKTVWLDSTQFDVDALTQDALQRWVRHVESGFYCQDTGMHQSVSVVQFLQRFLKPINATQSNQAAIEHVFATGEL